MPIRKHYASFAGLSLFVAASVLVAGLAYTVHTSSMIGPQLTEALALSRSSGSLTTLTTEVYDRSGVKIGEFAAGQRYFRPLTELPTAVIQAFLSAEDKGFYSHPGLDPLSTLRALLLNLRRGGRRQGASTITQQLARQLFLNQDKTLERKVKEALLALAIERRLSKDQILELYLNNIYFGNHSYGIEAAARNYLRKEASRLTPGEAALLAGLPKSPNAYAPHRHFAVAKKRQLAVLQRMEADHALASGEASKIHAEPLTIAAGPEDFTAQTGYVLAAVRRELQRKFELQRLPLQGLRITTTIDAEQQRRSASLLPKILPQLQPGGHLEGAVVSLDPVFGGILAMQGGRDFNRSQYNRAMASRRPLGAVFVPIYVALALDSGYRLDSRIGEEGPQKAGPGPGPTIKELLGLGPVAAAPLYTALGHESVQDFAKRLGLHFAQDDLSLALGRGRASPLEVAVAYASMHNGGRLIVPHLIDSITNSDGQELYRSSKALDDRPQVMDSAAAAMMSTALHRPAAAGPGLGTVVEDGHDAWYIGGQPEQVVVLWVGTEGGQARLRSPPPVVIGHLAGAWRHLVHKQDNSLHSSQLDLSTQPKKPGSKTF